MKEYIKTIISRDKLYEKNYTRDSIEKVKMQENTACNSDNYKALIDILTLRYTENN